MRGRQKHCFVNFCSLTVLESSLDEVEWDRKSYLGPGEIRPATLLKRDSNTGVFL